ncbi:hypothetical protein [Arthrobacter sp. UYEF20]|uniref:hypothetical protein n=1 Tax=Arthrobacter sp. UYEF20 TaxID=1756363 RepID=UPI0033928AB1
MGAGSSVGGGRQAMTELIENRRMPSAIFASSSTAFGTMMALRDLGLSASKNEFIIGVDDHRMGRFLGQTAIAQPVADQGAFAASLLIEDFTARGFRIARPATCWRPNWLSPRAPAAGADAGTRRPAATTTQRLPVHGVPSRVTATDFPQV